MTFGWAWALLGWVALAIAIHVHQYVRGFLPEDPPAPRKPKPYPVPMVGWLVAILGVVLAGLGSAGVAWCGAAALAWLAGTLDDFRKAKGGLVWWQKAVLLAIAAGLAAHAHGHAGPVAVLFLFVVVNAVNFLDNTDGVALGIAALPLALVGKASGQPGLGWLGAVFLGTLPHNWPRSRVILGDGGAYVLGLALGSVALAQPGTLATCAVVALPLVDFVQVVLARLWLGYAPWIADRRHLTHIAVWCGLPRALVAPVFTLCALAILGILRGLEGV